MFLSLLTVKKWSVRDCIKTQEMEIMSNSAYFRQQYYYPWILGSDSWGYSSVFKWAKILLMETKSTKPA